MNEKEARRLINAKLTNLREVIFKWVIEINYYMN
jgi:hypothetical protein